MSNAKPILGEDTIFGRRYYRDDDYAALEAENARLERLVSHWQGLAVTNRKVADDALAELSALKAQQVGVIREAETMGVAPYADIWPWLVPGTKLYTLPSAAPAQEVPDHFRGVTQMAEQGERQEAVVYAVHAKGAQVDHHCPSCSGRVSPERRVCGLCLGRGVVPVEREQHRPRRRPSGDYECCCGAVWDADEGSDCPNL